MVKKLSLFITILLYAYCYNCYGKIIIWDLGGVLCDPNKLGVAREIGLKNFITYTLFDWKNPNVQALIFDVLERIKLKKSSKNKGESKNRAATAEGMPLPEIMCQWQSGEKSGYEIIKIANKHIRNLDRNGYFISDREKVLVKKTINGMFNPAILARNIDPIKKGLDLVKECARMRTKNGKRKHKLIAFSNWDPLSFNLFYRKHKKLFKDFDHVIVSGDIGLIKPHRNAYRYLIKKYKLNPKDCILIDDQEINARGAQRCGMQALVVYDGDYEYLREQLVSLGALKNK